LAGGILAGRYDRLDSVPEGSRASLVPMARDRMNERSLAVAAALGELARERGLSTSQLALLWAKDQPGVTAPIIGPRTLTQLDDALAVLEVDLDDDARVVCDELVHPGNAVADFYSTAFWMRAEVG
jgi:aryl-alcohol dehydrogenase-like predicted oxidoreductase